VKPVSAQAWTDTIDTAVDVALACGCRTLVLSTGRTSELAAQRFFSRSEKKRLQPECFVMMGDHVGHSLRTCARKKVEDVILAGQFAKLLKIACGHEQTHVSSSQLDLRTLAGWLDMSPQTSRFSQLALQSNTARQVLEDSAHDAALVALVCGKAIAAVADLSAGLRVKVLLAGYHGEVIYFG
jgi:cobalt-precorrin-5B (C1)-methyltransferase